MDGVEQACLECPAKINLSLSVTGREADGFHNLISLVAPVDFGDRLEVRRETGSGVSLEVEGESVPLGEDNLVLKAARLFLGNFSAGGRFAFFLKKRVPVGAGLGGGSSDAVGALLILNRMLGNPATERDLYTMAGVLGSDCPFFVRASPAIMRGRGDKLESLNDLEAERLLGRRVILFKPLPGVSTVWAYRELARSARYSNPDHAEAVLADWRSGRGSLESLLNNDFEIVVGAKYPGIPVLLRELRRDSGALAMMSGSGSACFLLPVDGSEEGAIARIREAWGADAFCVETMIGKRSLTTP